jgi:hypothetical protein
VTKDPASPAGPAGRAGQRATAMQQDRQSQSALPAGRRPPGYVIVVAASRWAKGHFPAAATANLDDALRTGHDRHPQPDLEAEP